MFLRLRIRVLSEGDNLSRINYKDYNRLGGLRQIKRIQTRQNRKQQACACTLYESIIKLISGKMVIKRDVQ